MATACTQDTTGSGTLGLIHEGATYSGDLVLAEGVDAVPTLASDLAADAIATPIEIEVEGELAIAWRRYAETPEQRRVSDVVALWRVVDRVPAAATEPEAPIELSAEELGIERQEQDLDYLLVDLENRMQLGEEFDPALWEAWQLFRDAHAVCP